MLRYSLPRAWIVAYVIGGPQLRVNRLRYDGTVVPDDGALEASAVWTGEEYAVVWADDTSPDDVVCLQRVASDGSRVGSNLLITPPGDEGSRRPSVDWSARRVSRSIIDRS